MLMYGISGEYNTDCDVQHFFINDNINIIIERSTLTILTFMMFSKVHMYTSSNIQLHGYQHGVVCFASEQQMF